VIPSNTRREFVYGLGATLGTAALNSLLQAEEAAREKSPAPRSPLPSPLAPKPQHHPAKAKSCIMLFMEGGPSHIDTFDPKPALDKLDMQEFQRSDRFQSQMSSGTRYYIKSPFKFRQAGKSGMWMCDQWEHLAGVADELCVYRGCQAESIDHPIALYQMNTGNRFAGDPAVGSWVSYGLGTINQNLPSFVVLPEVCVPQGGTSNWGSGFLPAYHQGTSLRATGSPLLDLAPPQGVTRDVQRKNLDLLASLNKQHQAQHAQHDALAVRTEAYELAYRMQTEVPDLVDIGDEDQRTLAAYGIGQADTDVFGRRCLMARRLVEKGVRFVQVYSSGWDSHDYLATNHASRIKSVDKPIAALLADLRQRGMLDETLVFWTGEFGRSPDNGIRQGANRRPGRDHNVGGMAMWMAGGGVNAGHTIGATDELGEKAVDVVHPIKDLHVTLLHLLGLDDNKLTYFHAGRFKQLSQVGGSVIKELIA